MESKSKKIDYSLFKSFEYLLEIPSVFLLMYAILLFDFLEILVYKNGILDTDFLTFFDLAKLPFLLLFLVVFGVIISILSSLANVALYKLYIGILYKTKEILKLEAKHAENSINIYSLYEIALIAEDKFLMEYINNERKSLIMSKKTYRIVYSLLIAIIFNLSLTIKSKKNTLLKFIYDLCTNNDCVFVKILTLSLLILIGLTILVAVHGSLTKREEEIYYPDTKFRKLVEENKELLLR